MGDGFFFEVRVETLADGEEVVFGAAGEEEEL